MPVGLLAARGEHEHGHVALLADAPQDLEAVQPAGQHHVQDHRVKPLAAQRAFDPARAVVLDQRFVAEGREIIADQLAEFTVVVDHEKFHGLS